jgi:hypothetical protein
VRGAGNGPRSTSVLKTHMSKPESIPSQAELQSIINALSVVEHLLQPMYRSTTLNLVLDPKDFKRGTDLLKDCSARLKIYKRSVQSVTKKKQKEKGLNDTSNL